VKINRQRSFDAMLEWERLWADLGPRSQIRQTLLMEHRAWNMEHVAWKGCAP